MQKLMSLNEVKQVVREKPLVLMVIKTGQCGVCESVQAKVAVMLESHADIMGIYVYMEDAPDAASEYLALAAPTVLLFYEGKEVYRAARFVRFDELEYVLAQYEEALGEG
ncbi:thioredoxin family protein [Paenibacillus lutrae]|uniref:Thioredoxin n=1 Tax=Paenibacillus lutrae TaxID=2078573 RepID=A0A7X3FJ18_9BACL|nr:thioredoxin family protein [Paenibacillus lutrae]MVP00635.1 thioredoxin [Paenibacillus lutrae]